MNDCPAALRMALAKAEMDAMLARSEADRLRLENSLLSQIVDANIDRWAEEPPSWLDSDLLKTLAATRRKTQGLLEIVCNSRDKACARAEQLERERNKAMAEVNRLLSGKEMNR